MASISQVGIEIQTLGEREAVAALNRLDQAIAKQIVTSSKAAQSAGVFIREMRKMDEASRVARDFARASQEQMRAMQQVALANKSAADSVAVYEREIDRLRTKFNPLYAASKRYETSLEELKRAQQLGAITSQQYEAALERLNTELATGTTAATAAARQGMSRASVAIQQTGYQVGDFLVQVQSGTNAFVAFGQQATQMAGLLTLSMNPTLIALGAALSIVIPLTTAVAAGIMRSRSAAEDTAKAFDGVGASLRALEGARIAKFGEDLFRYAQRARQEFAGILDVIEQVQTRLLRESLQAPLREITREIARYENAVSVNLRFGGTGQIDYESAMGLKSRNEALFLATQLATLDGKTREELQRQLEAITQAVRLRGLMTDEVQALLARLADEVGLVESVKAAAEDAAAAFADASKYTDELRESLKYVAAANAPLTTQVAILRQQAAALREGADYATEMARATMLLAKADFARSAMESGMAPEDIAAGLGMIGERIRLQAEIEGYKPEGGRGGGGGRSRETIDDYLSKLEREAALKRRVATLSEDVQRVEERRFSILEALKTKQGEVTDATRARVDALIDEEEAALRSAEAQKRREATIASFTSSFEQGIYGMVTNVEDAFRNMLTNILAEIYKQEVVSPLSKGLGDLLGGFLRNANGNAFDGGKVVPFARGGIVNTPTMFPMRNGTGLMGEAGPEAVMPLKRMRGGKLGVVAEQRSEPQEVAVRVFVDDNGNLDAKVEQVSARVVRSAAPGIVQNAVGAVVKQVQRGGSVKDAFK